MAIEVETEPLVVQRRCVVFTVPGVDGKLRLSCRDFGLERDYFMLGVDDTHLSMTIVRLWLAGVNGHEIHRALKLGISTKGG